MCLGQSPAPRAAAESLQAAAAEPGLQPSLRRPQRGASQVEKLPDGKKLRWQLTAAPWEKEVSTVKRAALRVETPGARKGRSDFIPEFSCQGV